MTTRKIQPTVKILIVFSLIIGIWASMFFHLTHGQRTKTRLLEKRSKEEKLIDKCKSLQDSIADLEQKARILNNYLHIKHLEYIEVCNLVHDPKKTN